MPLVGDCWFINEAGGLADWIYPNGSLDYQSPAVAGCVDGETYVYRAQNFDQTVWEVGSGAYDEGTGTFARTTVLFNSDGDTAKINFSDPPHVVIRSAAESGGGGTVDDDSPWTAYAPIVTALSGTFTSVSASGKYHTIGKTVFVSVSVTITTPGTGNYPLVTLPVAPASPSGQYLVGRETALNGAALIGQVDRAASGKLFIQKYDANPPNVAGWVLELSGAYESV